MDVILLKLNRDVYEGLQSVFRNIHGETAKTHKELISVVWIFVKECGVQTWADRLFLTWGSIYPCSSLAHAPPCFDQKQNASSPV